MLGTRLSPRQGSCQGDESRFLSLHWGGSLLHVRFARRELLQTILSAAVTDLQAGGCGGWSPGGDGVGRGRETGEGAVDPSIWGCHSRGVGGWNKQHLRGWLALS